MEGTCKGRVLGTLLGTLLLFTTSVRADETPLQKKPVGQDYEKLRASYYDQKRYPFLPLILPQMKQIFDPKAVRIDCRCYFLVDGTKQEMEEYSLWFSQGDLFLRYKTTVPDESMPNIVTIDGKVHAWHSDKKEGWILDRFEYDTFQCVRYAVDPSMLMEGTWIHARGNRELFTTRTEGKTTIVTSKEPFLQDAVVTLTFFDNPLWFQRMEAKTKDKTWVLEVDRPVILQEVPAEVKKLPEGVQFKAQPGMTLQAFMPYV